MTTYLRKILFTFVTVVALASVALVVSKQHEGRWTLSPIRLNSSNPLIENTRETDASRTNVIIAYTPIIAPDGIRLLEYSIDRDVYEKLPVWNPETSGDKSIPMPLYDAIEIAQRDIKERYGMQSDIISLNSAGLGHIGDRNGGRWFYAVLFNVNIDSSLVLRNQCENEILTTIVLMDGSIVDPKQSELSL